MMDRRVVMKENRTNNIVHGALILTIAGLLSKVLSATYRVPLQNLTGDLGFYIYQQVYPLIGTVMILALYGFPVAISKLTAERQASYDPLTWSTFYFPLFLVLFVINGIFFAILYSLAPIIVVWIGDEALLQAFRLASFVFLLIPFIALLRGAYQGQGMMKQTAYSQVAEQLIRVTIIIIASYLIYKNKLNIYQIGEAGVLATLIGMTVAIVLLLLFIPKNRHKQASTLPDKPIPWKYYVTTCLTLGVLATFNHLVLLLMQMVDMLTLVPSLMASGLSSVMAMEAKGIFDRGQPLIQFGVVFGSSFALALIPNVVRQQTIHIKKQAESIRDALLFGFYLTVGATAGLFTLMKETNMLLFTNSDGTSSLQILSLTIVLTALTITGAAVLQSLGQLKWIMYSITGAVAMKVSLNLLLVPYYDIRGSAAATVLSMLFLCTIIVTFLHKKLPEIKFMQHVRWGALLIATVGMISYLMLSKYIIFTSFELGRGLLLIYMIGVIASGASIYLLLLLRYRVFTSKQIQALPFATFIWKLAEKVAKKG